MACTHNFRDMATAEYGECVACMRAALQTCEQRTVEALVRTGYLQPEAGATAIRALEDARRVPLSDPPATGERFVATIQVLDPEDPLHRRVLFTAEVAVKPLPGVVINGCTIVFTRGDDPVNHQQAVDLQPERPA